MNASIRLLLLFVVAFLSGCTRMAPRQVAIPPASADPVRILHADLDGIFSDDRFAQAELGVEVYSLDHSEMLYEMNSRRLFIPASTNKVITTAVALVRLGPDFRYETSVLTDGQIEDGVLNGNLIVAGSGDPTNSPRFHAGDVFATFKSWAAAMKQQNISAIKGSIVGVDGAFTGPGAGFGWEWNDLDQAYAAPAGALQFNDNTVTLEILAAAKQGNPASIRVSPLEDYLKLTKSVVTGPAGNPADIRIRQGDQNEAILVSGTVPENGPPVLRTVAARRPTDYYLWALKRTLTQEGIAADACAIREGQSLDRTAKVLWVHSSPPLSDIMKSLMKDSVNVYAETLVRTLGLKLRGEGSFSRGKEVVEETLGQMGIAAGTYSYADGSGLSRLNLESADVLLQVLAFMYHQKSFQSFYDALPIAGIDGTLFSRLRGTKAENNVRAKTGTMTNVSSISGYVRTADGEMLAFCIAANNFLGPKGPAESLQDRALERLANFSRKRR